MPNPGQLLELVIGDTAEAWRSAGFAVADDRTELDGVVLRFCGEADGRGLQSWTLHDVADPIDGLPTGDALGAPGTAEPHPNSITHIDHVVVETDDFSRTIPELERAGLELRRSRTFDFGDGERQQSFFWLGSVILELVGMVGAAADAAPPARFWGLALTSPDLDATAEYLGGATSPPKDAVQKGRRISTLRTRDLGISVPVAIMSPHPRR